MLRLRYRDYQLEGGIPKQIQNSIRLFNVTSLDTPNGGSFFGGRRLGMEPDDYPFVYLGNSRFDGEGFPVYMLCWYISGFGALDGSGGVRSAFTYTGFQTPFFPDNGDFDAVLERTRAALRYRALLSQRSDEPNPVNERPEGPDSL